MLVRSFARSLVRSFARSLVLLSAVVLAPPALAQRMVDCHWQLSLDNGTTWQTGSIVAPQSQASVWVRAVTTLRESGVAVPSGSVPNLTYALMEGWSTTAAPNADVVTGVSRITPAVPVAVLPSPRPLSLQSAVSRRVDNVLFVDRITDTLPPGQGLGIAIDNFPGGQGQVHGIANPLPIFLMSIGLDGTVGDRVLSGAFVSGSRFSIPVPAGHVLAGNPGAPSTWTAAPVTQFPVTLTIVPSPGGAAVVVGGVMLALRRRRG